MHRLRSSSAIIRFRIAALMLCAKCILSPIAAGLLIYSILIHDDPLTLVAVGLVVVCALLILTQWMISQRTNCPLCITPVLAKRNCAKSRHARTFLGSHRLRVALSILLRNSFRCPYCNEPTVLEVRHRNQAYRPYSKG